MEKTQIRIMVDDSTLGRIQRLVQPLFPPIQRTPVKDPTPLYLIREAEDCPCNDCWRRLRCRLDQHECGEFSMYVSGNKRSREKSRNGTGLKQSAKH